MNRKKLIILSFIFIIIFSVNINSVRAEAPECTSGTSCATRLFRTSSVIPYPDNVGDWEAYKYKTLYRSNSSMPYNLVGGVKTLSIYNAFCIYPQKRSNAAVEASTNYGGVYYYNGKEITGQYSILQFFLYYGYGGPGWSNVLVYGPGQASQAGSTYGDVYTVYTRLCSEFGQGTGTGINKCTDDDLYVVTHNLLSYISYQQNLEGHGSTLSGGDGRYNSTVTGNNLTTRFSSKISEMYATYIGRHTDTTDHNGTFFVYYLDNGNQYQDYIYWLDVKEMRDHPYINVLKYIDGNFPASPTQKFKFGLYSDSNCTNLIKSQETGIVGDYDEVLRPWGRTVFIDLARNTNYWIKELEVPSGYTDDTGCVKANPIGETSGTSVNYNNKTGVTPTYGAIEFVKSFDNSDSTYHNTNTYHYKYAVTRVSDGRSMGDVLTDNTGKVKYGYDSSNNKILELNTSYEFTEYVNSDGYAIVYDSNGSQIGISDYKPEDSYKRYEVEENPSSDGTEEYPNKLTEKYCAKVQKKDRNKNTEINDNTTKFTLYSNSNCSNVVVNATSTSNSIATFSNLDKVDYYVKETTAPIGYSLNSTCTSISKSELIRQNTDGTCPGSVTKAIENTPLYISFYKVREDGTTPLEGTTFNIKSGNNYIKVTGKDSNYNNCYVYNGTSSTNTGSDTKMVADSTGHICVAKVLAGNSYVAKEVEPGSDGYYIFDDGEINLTIGTDVQGKVSSNSLINKPFVIQLVKTKEDSSSYYDGNYVNAGASFKVKDNDGKYIKVSGTSQVDGYKGCYIFDPYLHFYYQKLDMFFIILYLMNYRLMIMTNMMG